LVLLLEIFVPADPIVDDVKTKVASIFYNRLGL